MSALALVCGLVAAAALGAAAIGAAAMTWLRDGFASLHAASLVASAAPVGAAAAALPALAAEPGGLLRLLLFVLLSVASCGIATHAIGRALHLRRREERAAA